MLLSLFIENFHIPLAFPSPREVEWTTITIIPIFHVINWNSELRKAMVNVKRTKSRKENLQFKMWTERIEFNFSLYQNPIKKKSEKIVRERVNPYRK